MNRRNLLRTMCTLPLASALSACKHEREPSSPSKGTLKVILNGPFGVVLDSTKDYRITAYVPSAPEYQHELRFRGPSEIAGRDTKTNKSPGYSYELLHEGLEIGRGRPQIDQGFYDFNFPHIGNWALPKDVFVVVDLPRPDFITFTPPALPVLLGGKPTLQPLDHILEYRMSDPDDVRVKTGDKPIKPLHCSELLQQYKDYLAKTKYHLTDPQDSQVKNMEEMLESSAAGDLCLLFAVGFDDEHAPLDPVQHGISFFNNVLLPSLAPDVKRRLQKESCTPAGTDEGPRSALVPAALRYPVSRPRLLQVASTVDCQSGGGMGTLP